ncbi:MAG: NADH-quinone oxidoreductase subunit L [Candidatus Sericytochromatia bacterium]|nr:MAG: NADH-quinone oxidoreductase subunit L [Candidatus Sericytochromatia bacterium]
MIDSKFLLLIPLLPLIGSIISGLYSLLNSEKTNYKINENLVSFISCATPIISFLISLMFFLSLNNLEEKLITYNFYNWISSGYLNVDFELMLDPLSSMMTIVITFIGSLIHIYSISYMHNDRGFARYFSYLNLFTFSMLILVLAKNLPLMFLGWEGVGLCSYLLIGFWFQDKEKAIAGNKAFITNRIGDLGFLIGIFLIFWQIGTLDFIDINQKVSEMNLEIITLITLLLFVGAMGKSAQIPLHVWLPDAMAGPTPVSALIHAATMVTAGIYMIVRLNVLYSLSPFTLSIVASIGLFTAFFAATVAITQDDIKKVLAYSTVSQLGYMFLGVGIGAYTAGTFHLFTHAFFKALLFLGSGSVIHAMSNEQNIWKMGGLFSKMKITAITFCIGTLAISGIPPFAGFFSKDEILWKVFESGNILFYIIALFTSFLTAFYMSRLFFVVFFGNLRIKDENIISHIHESPIFMIIPLIILAVFSTIVGFLGIPHSSLFESWLSPIIVKQNEIQHYQNSMEIVLMFISVLIAILGISSAYYFYVVKNNIVENLYNNPKLKPIYKMSYNKWYFDEVYRDIIIKPLYFISNNILFVIDKYLIDGFVNGISKLYSAMSYAFRDIQSGIVRHYAYFMIFGMFIIFLISIF